MVHPETSAYARGQRDDFVQLSIDLVRFRRLGIMQGDYEQGVTFNEDLARKKGFSEQEIALGKQIVEATNILIAQSKTAQAKGELASVDRFSLDLQRYPELRQFWNEAANVDVRSAQMNDLQSILEPLDVSGVSHWVCGYYFHPVPAQSAPWHTHHSSDPAATLRSWGYHPTPNLAGGGWTRPQTYKWWLCGWSTYRDHAYIVNSSTFREQNYTGTVPGEPNPEVYRSGPWPYPDWPVYVLCWHQEGPGR